MTALHHTAGHLHVPGDLDESTWTIHYRTVAVWAPRDREPTGAEMHDAILDLVDLRDQVVDAVDDGPHVDHDGELWWSIPDLDDVLMRARRAEVPPAAAEAAEVRALVAENERLRDALRGVSRVRPTLADGSAGGGS